MVTGVTDDHARTLPRLWCDHLETIEPLRSPLHADRMRLTGNVSDAADLAQETLLKGFDMIGRGDLHGAGSPVANVRAHLFRTATRLLIDTSSTRCRRRAAQGARSCTCRGDRHTVDQLHCSVGAVKSVLQRAGAGLRDQSPTARTGTPRALIDACVQTHDAKDLDRLLAVLTEKPSIEVLVVGGRRG